MEIKKKNTRIVELQDGGFQPQYTIGVEWCPVSWIQMPLPFNEAYRNRRFNTLKKAEAGLDAFIEDYNKGEREKTYTVVKTYK